MEIELKSILAELKVYQEGVRPVDPKHLAYCVDGAFALILNLQNEVKTLSDRIKAIEQSGH